MNVRIVTDSTSDLSPELAARHVVAVVPAVLVMEEATYLDGAGISREEFYQRLPAMKSPPTTAAPSVGSFQEVYERLFSGGARHVLSVHCATTLSGIYNAARLAAEAFGGRVQVVDSGQLSLGLGFQALAGAEASAAGADVEQALSAVHAVRARVAVAALLDTLEYLRRSGRVTWARARVAEMLQLKPLITLKDGKVERAGQARTGNQGMLRLYDMLRAVGPLKRLAVLHTGAESRARQLLEEMRPETPEPPLVVNVTTVIGTHLGPNGVGFAAVPA